jgi:sulfoxide reductase catalytic subunit YedY
MRTRRHFLTLTFGGVLGEGLLHLLSPAIRRARAAGRKILSKGTRRESLIHENPAALDTRDLAITPLDQFGTMGPTDRDVNLDAWRLEVSGRVKRPLSLTFAQLMALPSIERQILLICPGFFANHGRWRGVSIKGLLEQADFERAAASVSIESKTGKTARFPMADVVSDKVFLAYEVNGQALPKKHGFPLRVVAEDHYGSEWVKYVDKVTVERA